MPLISVITPASRGVKELTNLLNDFKNQTFRDFEHIIVYDGIPSKEIIYLMNNMANPWTRFCHIKKDLGNMKESPGTNPRNHGINISKGEYLVFADDDDRENLILLSLLWQANERFWFGISYQRQDFQSKSLPDLDQENELEPIETLSVRVLAQFP